MARLWTLPGLAGGLLLAGAATVTAQGSAPPITIGAGVRSSFVYNEPEVGDSTNKLNVDFARLYLSGPVDDKIKLTFNTEYNSAQNDVEVLDAIVQFEFSPKFNLWAGRFLPPSDRANLYGPFYAHHWSVYSDGIQDGYPFIFQGRANGAAYWGQFGKVKVSGGAFDGETLTGDTTVLGAGRVQVDFWDPEPGYYQNATYYGEKNILALGIAGQVQGGEKQAYTFDFLLERKVSGGGAYTVEAEWARYDFLGGYNSRYGVDQGGYVLGSYLFPKVVGRGKFEVLAKYAHAKFSEGRTAIDVDYDQKTTELNLNYVIKQFNARVMMFFKDTRFNAVNPDFKQFGVGLQFQM